jgi:hypothetical protein
LPLVRHVALRLAIWRSAGSRPPPRGGMANLRPGLAPPTAQAEGGASNPKEEPGRGGLCVPLARRRRAGDARLLCVPPLRGGKALGGQAPPEGGHEVPRGRDAA